MSLWWRKSTAAYGQDPGGGGGGGTLPIIPANKAQALADFVGVNTHFAKDTSKYGSTSLQAASDQAISVFTTLGIKHIRDSQVVGNTYQKRIWVDLHTQLGVRVGGPCGIRKADGAGSVTGGGATPAQLVAEANSFYGGPNGVIEQYEGLNEVNNQSGVTTGWQTGALSWQNSVWAAANPAGFHVLAASLARRTDYQTQGNYGSLCHEGNIHAYNGGNLPGSRFGAAAAGEQQYVSPGKTVQLTECGEHNAMKYTGTHFPTPEDVCTDYLARTLLEAFRDARISRAYLYELFDEHADAALTDNQQHFGLYRYDGTIKPGGQTIANMMTLIAEPSPGTSFTPVGLGYTVVGDAATHSILFEKSNGTKYVVICREVSEWNAAQYPPGGTYLSGSATFKAPTTQKVTVTLGSLPTSGVKVYRPAIQSAPQTTLTGLTVLSFNIAGEIVILELAP